MIAVQKIALDIIRSNKCKVIRSKQGDCLTRFAEITVTKEGEVVFVPNNITVLVNVKRADDAQRIYVGSVNDNGTVQIPINTWMNEVAGIGQLDISLLDGETKLSTMYVQFDVDEGACAHMQDDEGGDVITHVLGELDKKIDKVDGMGLSSNDYTNEDKELLHSFESNINTIKVNGEEQKIVDKVVDICVPTRINELENDSDFANQDYVTNEISKEEKERISADKAINEILSSFSEEIEQNKKDIGDLKTDVDDIPEITIDEDLEQHHYIINTKDKTGTCAYYLPDEERWKEWEYNISELSRNIQNLFSQVDGHFLDIQDLYYELNNIPKQIIIKNVTVPSSSFVKNNTFEDYPYRANISIEGVTREDYVNISFALSDVQSKNYAPICTTDFEIISIYAVETPLSDITIPLIEVIKV